MKNVLRFLMLTLVFAGVPVHVRAQEQSSANASLLAADQHYRSGKLAAKNYQAALKESATLVPAQVGLIRCWLQLQKVDMAYVEGIRYLELQPRSAPLLATMGDVRFQRRRNVHRGRCRRHLYKFQ